MLIRCTYLLFLWMSWRLLGPLVSASSTTTLGSSCSSSLMYLHLHPSENQEILFSLLSLHNRIIALPSSSLFIGYSVSLCTLFFTFNMQQTVTHQDRCNYFIQKNEKCNAYFSTNTKCKSSDSKTQTLRNRIVNEVRRGKIGASVVRYSTRGIISVEF